MKLDPRDVRFVGVLPWFGRRGLRFVGRGNSVQLLETALVIEGSQKTIGLFLVDLLFQQALSEWTTITVPYSRVESCRFSRMWVAKFVFLAPIALFGVLPCVGLTAANALIGSGLSAAETAMAALPGFGFLLLAIYVVVRFLGARHYLVFRRADGQRVLTCFRIRKRALRAAFDDRLVANRRAAGGTLPAPSEGADRDGRSD
jgi:hypothetical protein